MSAIAGLLDSFRRTMPEAGAGMRDASENYLKTSLYRDKMAQDEKQNQLSNMIDMEKIDLEKEKGDREQAKFDREQRLAKMKEILGPASAAKDETQWKEAQRQGFIPKDLPFSAKEPFIFSIMTEGERLNRENAARDQKNKDRQFGLDTKKYALDVQKERREASGGGTSGMKSSDESAMGRMIATIFEGNYAPDTGEFMIKDYPNRIKAQKTLALASRLKKNDPSMTYAEAVSEAGRRMGISNLTPYSEPAPASGTVNREDDPLGWRQ